MSIERTGPERYEEQYRATVVLMLLLWDQIRTAQVEVAGGEDATLVLGTPYGERRLEAQMKFSTAQVGVSELAAWLLHFPRASAADSLLERLLATRSLIVLFVAAGRATDAVARLVEEPVPTLTTRGARPRVLQRHVSELLSAIADCFDGSHASGSLVAQRRERAIALGASSVRALQTALQRVAIWEEQTTATMEDLAAKILRLKFRVPDRDGRALYDGELRRCIERARSSGDDLRPEFLLAIRRFQAGRVLSREVDVERPGVAALTDVLERERVLLICGGSRAGKSHTAEWIAQRLQDEGVEVAWSDDGVAGDATRFLVNRVDANERLFVLHDPFGALSLMSDARETRKRLEDMLAKLPTQGV